MHFSDKLACGATVKVIVPQQTEARLAGTCFRGISLKKAGNFKLWESATELFQDQTVVRLLLEELDSQWVEGELGVFSATFIHPEQIGWESTSPISAEVADALEPFNLNRHSTGLRVRADRTDMLAPLTHGLTVIYELKDDCGGPISIIRSIYPGADVGELDGDVTNREQRYFYGWEHPGR